MSKGTMILNGQERLIREVAVEYHVDKWVLRSRLKRGWSPEESVGLVERLFPLLDLVDFRGQKVPITKLAEDHGLTTICLRKRLAGGMGVEEAIAKPLEGRGGEVSLQQVTVNGETGTIKHFAEKYHQNDKAVYARLKLGWTLEEALAIKPRESSRGIYSHFNYATNPNQ